MRIHPLVFGLVLIHLLFSSCDTIKFVDNLAAKRYERRGGALQSLEIENTQLAFRVLGTGRDTLLLVHGFGPNPKMQWFKQIKSLSKAFTLIVPELVYFGDSHPLTNRSLFSLEYQADMLIGLLDSLAVERTHLLGISYGGMVSAFLSLKAQDRVDKVVIVDSPVKFYSQTYADSLAQAFGIKSAKELLLPDSGAGLRALLQASFYKPPRIGAKTLDKIVERYYFHQRMEKAALLDYLYRNEKFLSQIAFKTDKDILLIWGESDQLVPLTVGRQLQTYFGDKAKLVTIPKAGHAVNGERPKDFNREVLNFLSPPPASKKK